MISLRNFPRFRRVLGALSRRPANPLGRVVAENQTEYDTAYRFSCGAEFVRVHGFDEWEDRSGRPVTDRVLVAHIVERVAEYEKGEAGK